MKDGTRKILATLLIIAAALALLLLKKGGNFEAKPQNEGTGEDGKAREESLSEKEGLMEKQGEGLRGKLLEGWSEMPCIVIDAGHGGYDPGKVGVAGVMEKDVNLAIARFLRDDLEACGIKVIMTREEDASLCGEGEEQAKVRDLKNRIGIMEEAGAFIAVSIHQNSYPDPSVHGAQVFYYVTSVEGKALATALQARLISELDPENARQVKENDTYYLLKKTKAPLVIAECGFLSNPEEAEKLSREEYQKKVAWALYLGIMDYLEKK